MYVSWTSHPCPSSLDQGLMVKNEVVRALASSILKRLTNNIILMFYVCVVRFIYFGLTSLSFVWIKV